MHICGCARIGNYVKDLVLVAVPFRAGLQPLCKLCAAQGYQD